MTPAPRNLWREVTRCLRLGDIDAATEQKRRLEEKQRTEERKRENLRTPWRPKYFIQEVTLPGALGGEDGLSPIAAAGRVGGPGRSGHGGRGSPIREAHRPRGGTEWGCGCGGILPHKDDGPATLPSVADWSGSPSQTSSTPGWVGTFSMTAPFQSFASQGPNGGWTCRGGPRGSASRRCCWKWCWKGTPPHTPLTP